MQVPIDRGVQLGPFRRGWVARVTRVTLAPVSLVVVHNKRSRRVQIIRGRTSGKREAN